MSWTTGMIFTLNVAFTAFTAFTALTGADWVRRVDFST